MGTQQKVVGEVMIMQHKQKMTTNLRSERRRVIRMTEGAMDGPYDVEERNVGQQVKVGVTYEFVHKHLCHLCVESGTHT